MIEIVHQYVLLLLARESCGLEYQDYDGIIKRKPRHTIYFFEKIDNEKKNVNKN